MYCKRKLTVIIHVKEKLEWKLMNKKDKNLWKTLAKG